MASPFLKVHRFPLSVVVLALFLGGCTLATLGPSDEVIAPAPVPDADPDPGPVDPNPDPDPVTDPEEPTPLPEPEPTFGKVSARISLPTWTDRVEFSAHRVNLTNQQLTDANLVSSWKVYPANSRMPQVVESVSSPQLPTGLYRFRIKAWNHRDLKTSLDLEATTSFVTVKKDETAPLSLRFAPHEPAPLTLGTNTIAMKGVTATRWAVFRPDRAMKIVVKMKTNAGAFGLGAFDYQLRNLYDGKYLELRQSEGWVETPIPITIPLGGLIYLALAHVGGASEATITIVLKTSS